jgi:hypothetical protein
VLKILILAAGAQASDPQPALKHQMRSATPGVLHPLGSFLDRHSFIDLTPSIVKAIAARSGESVSVRTFPLQFFNLSSALPYVGIYASGAVGD